MVKNNAFATIDHNENSQRAPPSGLPQGVTDSLTSVCGQTMRIFAWFGRNGQLSCPARGEAAGGARPPVGRYHGRCPWCAGPYPGPGDGSPGKGLQGEGFPLLLIMCSRKLWAGSMASFYDNLHNFPILDLLVGVHSMAKGFP
jgi:hypothetical protein